MNCNRYDEKGSTIIKSRIDSILKFILTKLNPIIQTVISIANKNN